MMAKRKRKAKPRVKTDEESFALTAGEWLGRGDFSGLLTLSDWLEDRGERPDAVAFFRRVAAEADGDLALHFGRSGWVSYQNDTGPDFLFRKVRSCYEKAVAEDWAEHNEIGFLWEVDGDFDPSREIEGWDQSHNLAWYATAVSAPPGGYAIGCGIGGVTFGGDGYPAGDPYTRDVEAELAAELFSLHNEFYREPNGDYVAIDPYTAQPMHGAGIGHSNARVMNYDGRATAMAGVIGSVASTGVSEIFLAECIKVEPWEVPTEWRRLLVGV